MAHKLGEWHSDAKKIEAVTTYLVLGKAPLVEAVTGVPAGTIRRWKSEPWWEDLVAQIQTEDDQELDAKLAKRLSKALDLVDDRLSSGDFVFSSRTGEFYRRPVSLKDTWKVTKEMVDLRMLLRKQKQDRPSEEAVGDILKGLATEFAGMARKRLNERVINGEVINDGEELPEGVPELPVESLAEAQASHAEQSPENHDESGVGSEGGQPGCGPQATVGEGGLDQPIEPTSTVPIPKPEFRPYPFA